MNGREKDRPGMVCMRSRRDARTPVPGFIPDSCCKEDHAPSAAAMMVGRGSNRMATQAPPLRALARTHGTCIALSLSSLKRHRDTHRTLSEDNFCYHNDGNGKS